MDPKSLRAKHDYLHQQDKYFSLFFFCFILIDGVWNTVELYMLLISNMCFICETPPVKIFQVQSKQVQIYVGAETFTLNKSSLDLYLYLDRTVIPSSVSSNWAA